MSIPSNFNPLGSKKQVLPRGYRCVEYLESTGTQWIDTGMNFIDDYTFTAITKPVQEMRLFGSLPKPSIYVYLATFTGSPHQAYNNNELVTKGTDFVKNKIQTITLSRKGFTIDDKVYTFDTQPEGRFTTAASICLLKLGGSDTIKSIGANIYYYLVAKQSGEKVMELVPALDPSGRPCMYDLAGTGTVEQNTYYNAAASGPDFLWG